MAEQTLAGILNARQRFLQFVDNLAPISWPGTGAGPGRTIVRCVAGWRRRGLLWQL